MPVFVAVPASPDDLPEVARIQYEACASDPGFSCIFPGSLNTTSISHLADQLEQSMNEDPTAHILVAKDSMTGEIASYAVWHFLPSKSPEVVEEEMLGEFPGDGFPPGANIPLGKKLIENSNRKRHEITTACFGMGNPYGYLAAIGTNPRHQKQGAAHKLMEWGVERADDRNIPIYIEGTPVGLKLYQKFEFHVYDRLILDLSPFKEGEFANVCMIRFPQSGQIVQQ